MSSYFIMDEFEAFVVVVVGWGLLSIGFTLKLKD